ncbi:MAG: hypothetical protein ACE5FU_07760, partial [Nitrospinota bacterium]
WKTTGTTDDDHRFNLSYKIEPSLLIKHSVSTTFYNRKHPLGRLYLDKISQNLGAGENDSNLYNDGDYKPDSVEIYQLFLDVEPKEDVYFHLSSQYGKFKGNLEVKEGFSNFFIPDGSEYNFDTSWFRAEFLFFSDKNGFLFGSGLGYLKFEIPNALRRMRITKIGKDKNGDDQIVDAEALDAKITKTKYSAYYWKFGFSDSSYIGRGRLDQLFFMDAFLSLAIVKTETQEKTFSWTNSMVSFSFDASTGLTHRWVIHKYISIGFRLGVRFYRDQMGSTNSGKKNKGDEFEVSATRNTMWGPFASISGKF